MFGSRDVGGPRRVGGTTVCVDDHELRQVVRVQLGHDGLNGVDARGNPYFWIAFGRGGNPGASAGSDMAALNENRISVTPLRLDLTDEPFMTKLAEVLV